ncbi:MAG: lipase/acyltransferase domain-containing protein [Bacillota bacterium]
MERLVILVPGIMGSNLAYGSYRVWPRFFPSNIGVYEKYLPIGKSQLDPAGLVERVYKKINNHLQEIEGVTVKPFPYDWRENNLIAAEKLDKLLTEIHGCYDEINIVAHSMGGIVSKILLNTYFEQEYVPKIKKFITLGTPWHGSLDSYKSIVYGKSVPDYFPFHSIVLTKEKSKIISKGFPSVYQLFPDEEYQNRLEAEHQLSILTQNDVAVNCVEIFNQKEIKTPMEEIQLNYNNIIEEYREKVHLTNVNIDHISHHEIIGFGSTTLAAIKENKRNEVFGEFHDGDGTVPLFSSKLSTANHRYMIKDAEHQDLVKNNDSLKVVKSIILDESIDEHNSIYLDEDRVKLNGFKSKVLRIACPVEVSIVKDGKSIYGIGDSLDYDQENLDEMLDTNINVISLGNTIYVIFNDEKETVEEEKIIIEAYDEGPTSIAVEEYSYGIKSKTATFKTFNINPNMRAEINLNDDIEHTKLKIQDREQDVSTEEPFGIDNQDIVLPSTSSTFHADNEYIAEGIRVYSGEFKIQVEVREGTYGIEGTYIKVNGETILLNPEIEESVINLNEGHNKVKVFSVDDLGNEEITNEISIIYLNEFKPKFHIEMLPHQYQIDAKENEDIMNIITQYNLPRSEFQFELSEEENAFVDVNSLTVLTHNPTIREINITYNTFLGEFFETLIFDEFSILNLFEGIGNADNFNDLLNNLNLENPEKVKLTKLEGQGIYRKITDGNLNNAKKIIVNKDNKSLEVIKKSDYILSFHNLNEDIKVNDEEIYNFSFKVFDKENNERRTLELDAFLKVSVNQEDFITNEDDIEINFNQELDVYEGSFRIEILNEILNEYWETTPIHSTELVITKRGINSNIIRSKEINVRRD